MAALACPTIQQHCTLRSRVREEVREILEASGVCALLVTHDQEEALSFAARVAVMMDGRIVQVGSPEDVYHCPVSAGVAQFIGDGHLVACTVAAGRVSSEFGDATCEAADGPGRLFVRPKITKLATEMALYPSGIDAANGSPNMR